jgi:hypothetical protein
LVFFDLEADALESVLAVSSAVAFFFFFDFDALVSLWSVVVCCAAATRTQMLPATSSNATNRLNKRGLRGDFILEILSPGAPLVLYWHTGGCASRRGVKDHERVLCG